MTYCSGMGIGLLAIISCAGGLLSAIVLPSTDSALVASSIRAIAVTEVGRFSQSVLVPNDNKISYAFRRRG
jgi:hypothetical protein